MALPNRTPYRRGDPVAVEGQDSIAFNWSRGPLREDLPCKRESSPENTKSPSWMVPRILNCRKLSKIFFDIFCRF